MPSEFTAADLPGIVHPPARYRDLTSQSANSASPGLANLSGHIGQRVQLHAYALSSESIETTCGKPGLRIILCDSAASVLGVALQRHLGSVDLCSIPGPVHVHGEVVKGHTRQFLRVHKLTALLPERARFGAALLPMEKCPKVALHALQRLIRLESELPPVLREFLIRLCLDPDIAVPLLTACGGFSEHHDYAGGLLIHCTDPLDACLTLCRQKFGDDELSIGITMLAYFLHDIGKIVTCANGARSVAARTISHEIHGLLVLAPHLRWLRVQDERLSSALLGILDHVNGKTRPSQAAGFYGAEIVRKLDELDAADATDRDIHGFIRRPRPTVWALKQAQRYRRPQRLAQALREAENLPPGALPG